MYWSGVSGCDVLVSIDGWGVGVRWGGSIYPTSVLTAAVTVVTTIVVPVQGR